MKHGELAATVERSVCEGAEAGFVLDMLDGKNFVVFERKPKPNDETKEIDTEELCLPCLIDERPEVGRALDLARQYGAAVRIDGEWHADPG